MPNYVVGHSLGEYNALLASGVFDFETGLKIVKKRGELMSKAVGGSMAAVIGLSIEEINQIIIDNNLNIDLANINSPEQIVISGKVDDIVSSEDLFINGGAKNYIILKVGGAFHSRYMSEAANELKDFISDINFHLPQIPVISNLTAKPYDFDKESIVNNLSMQLNNPVRWTESIDYLIEKGNMNFHEISNTQILIGMLNKILRLKKNRT